MIAPLFLAEGDVVLRSLHVLQALIRFVLIGLHFSIVPGGLLSPPPGGSCILGGLALLLLVFQVDTISNCEISYIYKGTVVPTDGSN